MMIPITNDRLSILAEEHFEAIKVHLKNPRLKYTYDNINQWFMTNGSNLSFKEVVLANMERLPNIIEDYSGSNITEEIKYLKDNLYGAYFAKSSKCLGESGYNAVSLVEKLGIKVCPYCNRNFINNVTYANRGLKRTSQIDHFFCKEKYPYLAMSFYNLVPSCPSCNHLKGNQSIDYSPYDPRFNSSDLLHFDYQMLSVDALYDENQLEINLKPLNNCMVSNIEVFGLESQYKMHKDVVSDLIKKKLIYTKTKLTEIEKDFEKLFSSEEEIKRVLYGNYLNEIDLHKRPLAKLTSDIYKKLDED